MVSSRKILFIACILVLSVSFLWATAQKEITGDEGTVLNAYSIWPENWATPMFEEFEKATGIHVNFMRFSSGEALARVIAEQDNPQIDVLFGGPVETFAAGVKEGVFEAYKPAAYAKLEDKFKDSEGYWTAIADDPLCFMSNVEFLEKNNIPQAEFSKSDLLKKLVENNNREVILKNVDGGYHFNGRFRNATFLKEALSNLPGEYENLVQKEYQLVLDIYEKVFDHQSFTGRSGTFYGYEGLGCIYWHMVSKLLLAVNESYYIAVKNNVDVHTLSRLVEHYYEIRAGIGLNKSPELYGAFPTDPYSHTPGNAGAQQPGMTGQVKEDIICRFGELGVVIENGSISFKPVLIRKLEFFEKSGKFSFYDVNGISREILLEKNTLAFTYCQIPVKYKLSEYNKIIITKSNGSLIEISGDTIDKVTSQAIFNRTSEIVKIEVWLMPGL